jgi:hypothetical protein
MSVRRCIVNHAGSSKARSHHVRNLCEIGQRPPLRMQVHTMNVATGGRGPAMALQHFQQYAAQQYAAQRSGSPQQPRSAGNESPSQRSGSQGSDETLDSSMATGSAGPRPSTATKAALSVPEKWLRRALLVDKLPLQDTLMVADISVRFHLCILCGLMNPHTPPPPPPLAACPAVPHAHLSLALTLATVKPLSLSVKGADRGQLHDLAMHTRSKKSVASAGVGGAEGPRGQGVCVVCLWSVLPGGCSCFWFLWSVLLGRRCTVRPPSPPACLWFLWSCCCLMRFTLPSRTTQ